MKLLFVLPLLFINVVSAHAEISASILGEYVRKSGLKFYGYNEDTCGGHMGEFFNGEYNPGDGACYVPSSDTVSIFKNDQNKIIVKIDVVYGAANQRSFEGVVTAKIGNVLYLSEADVDDALVVQKIIKRGCKIQMTVSDETVVYEVGRTCRDNLGRASGAKKTHYETASSQDSQPTPATK